jgi:hypothetical protein
MSGKLQLAGVVAAGALALAVGGAGATTGKRSDFELGLSSRAAGAPAALKLHVLYKAEGDENAKPSPIRKVVISAPEGTRFNTAAVPVCEATDEEFRAQGLGACPAESRIGAGEFEAITGFGPGVDPVPGDLTLFNGGDEVVEVVSAKDTDRVLGLDRLHIDGSTLTGDPPTTPGGPPDGETAVRRIDFTIDEATGFVTTPPSCPAGGAWTSSGTFGFADGAEETLTSDTPCDVAPAASEGRLTLRPKRAAVGRATRFTARISGAAAGCERGATVRVGGRRVRSDSKGRAALTVTVRQAGAHRATAKKRGCPTLRAAFAGV